MNVISYRDIAMMFLASLLIVAASHAAAQPAGEQRLVEEFDALAAYEFGMSRAPLQRISAAVRAAAAGAPDSIYTTRDFEALLTEMLETDITIEARRFICRLLGEIGGADAAEALARQLTDDAAFHAALTALEQNPGSEAAVALAGALETVPGEKRPALLAAMGRQGNPASTPTLTAALADETSEIRAAAAQALADLSHPDACDALLRAISNAAGDEPALLADAFLQCADLLYERDDNQTAQVLEQLRHPDFPPHIRIAAIDVLMRCRPEQAQTLLLDALQDACPVLAHEALMLARATPGDAVIAALAELLEAAPPERKPALIAILSDFGDPQALPVALIMASHDQPEVRRAALSAVGTLGDAGQAEFLLERATTGPSDEQRTAREALARLADPEVDARLVSVAESRSAESLRLRAIAGLVERGANDAAPALLVLSMRAAPAIREEAIRALRTLAPPEMMPDLLGLITPRGLEPIREVLPQTLAQTAARIPDPDMRAASVIDALNAATNNEARMLLLETLGLIGGAQAFEAIRNYPETADTDVRRAMVSSLARFQSPEALDELRDIVLAEEDDGVRSRAYSGYVAALRNAAHIALRDVTPHVHTAREQARNAAEQREFLAAATQLPSLTTLSIITEMADDDETAAEALRAMLRVCAALTGAYPNEVRQHLESVIAQEDTPEPLTAEARAALAFIEQFDGHIMSWAIAGPYYKPNVSAEALFSHEFPPEADADAGNWRLLPTLTDASPPYALELDRVLGGDDRVAFLRTTIHADAAGEAVLELGTNDGCRVWWNGTLIHALNVGRALTPGEDKLPVQLEAGANDLMVAVFQHGAAWRATARLVTRDGQPIPGLQYSPALPEL